MSYNKTAINKQSFTKEETECYENFIDILLDIVLKNKKLNEEKNKDELIDKEFK